MCSKFNRTQCGRTCACAVACLCPQNSNSNVVVSVTLHDDMQKNMKPLWKVINIYMCAYSYTFTHVHIHLHLHLHIYIYIYMYLYIYMYMYRYMCRYMCVCVESLRTREPSALDAQLGASSPACSRRRTSRETSQVCDGVPRESGHTVSSR